MSLLTQSKPVLTYFDLYGKAEAVRMALVHSKTDFEDNRVSGESWATFKASGKVRRRRRAAAAAAAEQWPQCD